jgi:pyruvate dehydrogenase E2 component (dihydrolipoamide acetyltransferase)
MSTFVMPSLGADMDAGTLVEMMKEPGDAVHRGDIIAAVETQKGVIEIEVFEDGVLGDWLVQLGTKVPVGMALADIHGEGDPPAPEIPQPTEPTPPPVIPEAPQPQDPMPDLVPPEEPPPSMPPEIQRLRITPAARRKAQQSGIDLGQFPAGKTIGLSDLGQPQPSPLSAMRRAIAASMTRSKREIPHYYLSQTIDLMAADTFVTTQNRDRPPEARLLMPALFIKAIANALQKFPELNGFCENDSYTHSAATHVGLAINLRGGGLVAPAIHDADTLPLDAVMTTMRDLIGRVKAGRFRARELSDPTITLTSLGDRGVETIYGVIFPPQVAIIGIGTPNIRPWVNGHQLEPRLSATVTLSADHRVSDGHRGAQFLNSLNKHLQKPEKL